MYCNELLAQHVRKVTFIKYFFGLIIVIAVVHSRFAQIKILDAPTILSSESAQRQKTAKIYTQRTTSLK